MNLLSVDIVREISKKNNEPDWLTNKRIEAWKLFEKLPMPTLRDEEWRYTNLSGLKLDEINTNSDSNVLNQKITSSLNSGVIFMSMKSALEEHPDLINKFYMNAAV